MRRRALGSSLVGGLLLLVGCSGETSSIPGFRSLPNLCGLLSDRSVAEYLGKPVGSSPAEFDDPDNDGSAPNPKSDIVSQACKWEARDPPGWGKFGRAEIYVYVAINLNKDGSPDLSLAKTGFDIARRRDGEWLLRGERRIGDEAMQEYEGGDGMHGSKVTFRKVNANVSVHFEGIGNTYGNGPAYRSREYIESAAYQLAVEVNRGLGKPR